MRDAMTMFVPGLGDEVPNGPTVVSVEPAPHAGRLRVTVATDVADVADRAPVGRHLARATGVIREEVAHAISRRKVPELVFDTA